MMNKPKCIYCNRQDLTNSDIIPAFLTPKKMVKKFVCTYHNRSVGENYESQLAVMLKPLRNSLGLRNRVGEEFVSVKADIEYDGHVFHDVTFETINDLFWNNTIVKDLTEKTVTFAISDITGSKNLTLSIDYRDCAEALYSEQMKKCVAKISYEYYCKIKNITNFRNPYRSIVEYILNPTSTNNSFVQIVNDECLNQKLVNDFGKGLLCIFLFCDGNGDEYIIFDLWGIIAYKTLISNGSSMEMCTISDIYSQYYDGTALPLYLGNQNQIRDIPVEKNQDTIAKNVDRYCDSILTDDGLYITKTSLRNYIRKIEKILNATDRTDSEKLAYLIGIPFSKITKTVIVLLQIKTGWNNSLGFYKNIYRIFNCESGQTIRCDEEPIKEICGKGCSEALHTIQESVMFCDNLLKRQCNT